MPLAELKSEQEVERVLLYLKGRKESIHTIHSEVSSLGIQQYCVNAGDEPMNQISAAQPVDMDLHSHLRPSTSCH